MLVGLPIDVAWIHVFAVVTLLLRSRVTALHAASYAPVKPGQ